MAQEKTYRLQTNPADFSVLVSAMFTIAREMGSQHGTNRAGSHLLFRP